MYGLKFLVKNSVRTSYVNHQLVTYIILIEETKKNVIYWQVVLIII